MQYISHYESPLGRILLAADEEGLTGLWFEGQKYFARSLRNEQEEKEIPLFERAKRWLDLYFSGTEPDLSVPLHFLGTDFQKKVWEILCAIPYGHTMTYGEIAGHLAAEKEIVPHVGPGGRAARWAAIPSRSWCPVIGWWEPPAVSPAMPGAWIEK